MKKFFCAVSAVLLLLAFASCGQKEVNPDTYVGEGAKIQFRVLVDANQKLFNDVFVLGRLECDESKAFEKDGVRWAPVTDSSYASYKMLVENIKGIYTKECAEKLLKDYDFYDDIDGVFCRRINDDDMPGGKKWVRDTQKEPKITANSDGTYSGEYRLVCDDDSVKETFTFVKTEDGFRLDELSAAD